MDTGERDRRAEGARRLSRCHSLALRLRDAGIGTDLIAECLGLEPEAIGPLLVVAEAKLASALAGEHRTGDIRTGSPVGPG